MNPLVVAGVLGTILLVAVVWVVAIYNRLVVLRVRYQNAFAQIEVQLKRRHDLIPNLVETAKGYMAHERETLEAVIRARDAAVDRLGAASGAVGEAGAMGALTGAESDLSGALGRLFALAEAYPDLKANTTMAQLSEELVSTENRVAFARQAYNDSVGRYNAYKATFPPVLFAGAFGHADDAAFLEFESAAIAEPPKVSL